MVKQNITQKKQTIKKTSSEKIKATHALLNQKLIYRKAKNKRAKELQKERSNREIPSLRKLYALFENESFNITLKNPNKIKKQKKVNFGCKG